MKKWWTQAFNGHYFYFYSETLWCPVEPVLPQGEKASTALVGHPSSDGVTVKIPYGLDVLLHQPALHPIFS